MTRSIEASALDDTETGRFLNLQREHLRPSANVYDQVRIDSTTGAPRQRPRPKWHAGKFSKCEARPSHARLQQSQTPSFKSSLSLGAGQDVRGKCKLHLRRGIKGPAVDAAWPRATGLARPMGQASLRARAGFHLSCNSLRIRSTCTVFPAYR